MIWRKEKYNPKRINVKKKGKIVRKKEIHNIRIEKIGYII